jgi:SAM-dependent methyltransferase
VPAWPEPAFSPPDPGSSSNPEIDFAAYLEAKYSIDQASLNPRLFSLVSSRLMGTDSPRILDLGTGTGAMARRLLSLDLRGRVRLVGLDREADNLALARRRLEELVAGRGLRLLEVPEGGSGRPAGRPDGGASAGAARRSVGGVPTGQASQACMIRARRPGLELQIELVAGDLLDPQQLEHLGRGCFDCVTAHSFMDLLPLKAALRRIRVLLAGGGLFYATLNYDGETTLLPGWKEPQFERRLLGVYNRSMDRRRVGGRRTGGRLSGRRLYQALLEQGYEIQDVGSSDWNLFPHAGRYSRSERVFLTWLLTAIASEGRRDDKIDRQALCRWHRGRMGEMASGRLALVVHQLDLLCSPNGPPQESRKARSS